MSKKMVRLLILAAVGSSFTTGCYSHRVAVRQHEAAVVAAATTPPATKVIVVEAPPAPRSEAVGVAPDASHVWVGGYWMRSGQRWIWVPGTWQKRPGPAVDWVPGHWEKDPSGRGWTWTPGHWQ